MSVPREMMVVEIAAPGGPEQLRMARRPMPQPGEGEVLVRVAAAGVNRPDVMQRQGRYPPPAGASDIPGLEIAGEVIALGANVSGVALGDRVTALLPGGGYADHARRGRGTVFADTERSQHGRGGRAAGDVFHGLDQPLRARRLESRRVGSDPRRHQRHRYDGHTARRCLGSARVRHRRHGGEGARLRAAGRGARHRLSHARISSK